jgi:hypothetical protein
VRTFNHLSPRSCRSLWRVVPQTVPDDVTLTVLPIFHQLPNARLTPGGTVKVRTPVPWNFQCQAGIKEVVKKLIPAIAEGTGQALPNLVSWVFLLGNIGHVYLAGGNPVADAKLPRLRMQPETRWSSVPALLRISQRPSVRPSSRRMLSCKVSTIYQVVGRPFGGEKRLRRINRSLSTEKQSARSL